ncbi:hypothetical protein HGH93_21380 [Chitinophaga polysaccharea]|uniref:hypothetical protein n=1 Tax=Chitinophaga polysaccharea TaxID=1293035 RepID=UPI001455C9D3|nr:hypothetical protein [Chitinophaga polysaccharea]NLR60676.1 hypothetical protein [Chitinophaga polysaccharea]
MANFLEQPRQFNPYIQQIPLDIYATVGMQRQQQYDAGVQKVGGIINSLSGLNVARQVDADYLEGRVLELTSKVNKVASADWSNQALVGQVGKLASVISSDEIVKNAVIGTQRYLKDEADIAAAKTNGKWAPENEWILRREMASWMNAPQAGVSYQSSGYKPYVDVSAQVIKAWKDVNPDSTLVQKPNGDFYAYQVINNEKVGTDGRTLVETSIKELRPDEIASQINALLTGSQREQLAISGLYQNRNINDPDSINKMVDDHFRKTEDYYQKLLDNEKLELSLQAGDSKRVKIINDRISEIEKKRQQLDDNKKQIANSATSNPDGVKSSLYYESWLNGVSGMIGYSQNSTKIVDNPSYKAMLEELKIWTDLQKAQFSGTTSSSQKYSKKKGASGDDDNDGDVGWQPVTGTVLPLSEKDRAGITLQNFSSRLALMGQQMDQTMLELLYRQMGESYVTRTVKDLNNDGITEDVYTLRKEKQGDALSTQAKWWDAYRKGDPNMDITIKETLRDLDERRLVSSKLAKVLVDVDKKGTAYMQANPKFQQAKKADNIFAKTPPVNLYGEMIGPDQIRAYMKYRQENMKSEASAGVGSPGSVYIPVPDDTALTKYGLTRKNYNAMSKASSSYFGPEREHIGAMINLYGKTQVLMSELNKDKQNYINDEIKKYAGIFNEVALTLPSSKPEELRPIANLVSTVAANARETGMGGSTNWKKVREMIGEKHAKETAYSYVQDKDGNVRIRISNPDVDKNSPQEILLDSQTARINHFSIPDFLSSTRNMLELGENIRTGSSFEESIPTNNQMTGKYNVRHEVENFNGRFKVKLYVTEPGNTEVNAREIPINTVLFSDWNELTNFLSHDVNERFISSLLGKEQSVSSSALLPAGMQSSFFPNNPLIQQQTAGPK